MRVVQRLRSLARFWRVPDLVRDVDLGAAAEHGAEAETGTSHAGETLAHRIPEQRGKSPRAVGSRKAEPAQVSSNRSSVAKLALAATRPL